MSYFKTKQFVQLWDEEKEKWYFSIVDVVGVLTAQPDQRRAAKYWSVLKTRLKKEGSQLTTIYSQLRMISTDGKKYNTDVADTEQAIDRAFETYLKKGYTKEWISQRLLNIKISKGRKKKILEII